MQSARLPKFVPDPFAQRQGSPAITAAYTFTDRSELDKINWAGSQIEDRAYDAVGLLTGVDRPGVDETRAYDALNRVTSIGNTNVGDGTYTYDANSNKLSESWSGAMAAWNFITTNAGANPDGYDAEDRFTNFIQSGQSKTLGLTRSDIGNISNSNLNGTNTARGYSNIHALTSIGSTNQVFDTDGNLTNAQTGIDLVWDEAGMMKESIVGTGDTAGIEGTNTYGYDADRKRVWKKRILESSTNEHTVYIHAGPNVIAEYPAGTAAASPTQEYVYGQEIDSLVLLVRSGGTEKLTITRNQQWSVTALSDAASGSVLERYTYDHFGKRTILEPNGSTVRATSSYNMPFGYTSRQHDAETGLLFMRARYYDPLSGEFTSPDPLEYVDGMSLFRGYFVSGRVDPWGLKWKVDRNGGGKADAIPGDRNDTIDDLAKLIGLNSFESEAWLTLKNDNGMPFPGLNDPIGWTYCDLPEFQVPNTIYAVWAGEGGIFGAFFVCFADEVSYLQSLGFNVIAPENHNDGGALVGPRSIDYYNELKNLSSNKKIHGLYGMGHGNINYFFYGRRMGIDTVWVDEERIYNYKTSMSKLNYHLGFTLINACYSKSGATSLTSSNGISDGHVGVLDPMGMNWFGDSPMIWASETIFHGDQETK